MFSGFPFHFNCIMHSFVPPPSLFVSLTVTSPPSAYLICSLKKSVFERLPTVLHSCKSSFTFHGYSLLKFFFLHITIFQLPSIPSRRYADGFYRFYWHNQITTSVLYCVMYSSLEIAPISLVFVILDLVNLRLIISGWICYKHAKKVLAATSLLVTQESSIHRPSWFIAP